MAAQKGKVSGKIEGAFRHLDLHLRQGQDLGRIDQTQKVMMLGTGGERGKVLLADGKEDARGGFGQGGGGLCLIRNGLPVVPGLSGPCRARQTQMRHARRLGCRLGIDADPRGKRMGCVDQMGKAALGQILRQPLSPAKTADPHRNWLRRGLQGAPGIGIDGIKIAGGQFVGQSGGLGGAAKKKDAHGNLC